MIDVPVRVKDALREGCYRKNYKIIVFESDEETIDFTIDNNDLITESVKIDERMCSEDNIKFGLCEGTRIEFECYGIENITGRRLKLYIEVEYKDEHGDMLWYPITLGWFTVEKCSKNPDTNRIRVSCYNKLRSEYLNANANITIQEMFSNPDIPVHLIDIEQNLLNDYGIKEEEHERIPTSAIRQESVTLPIGVTIKAVVQYGIENPFCYYEMENRTDRLWMSSDAPYYNLDPNAPYRISFAKDFEVYEQRVYDQIFNIFDEAQLNKTAEEITSAFMVPYTVDDRVYKGFQNVIGVMLTKPDNTVEYYSTIGYENGCEGVVGTWKDLSQKVIYGYKKITLFLPRNLYALSGSPSQSGAFDTLLKFWGDRGYAFDYYIDSDFHSRLSYYPTPIKYSDGTVIQYYDCEEARYFYVDKITNLSDAELAEITPSDISDVTLRDLQSASFETQCQFGRLDRETDIFYGMELNNARLLPAEDLYPANDLFPISIAERVNRAMYEKLWCDEGQIKEFRNLVITYKGTEEQNGQIVEVDKIITKVVNADGTDDYICDDNWLFRNLVWTDSEMEDYADTMVTKMQNITWFPFELWCAGLPYIETGDEVEINIGEHAYTSYVLRRNINGIQDLHDEMQCGELDVF